MGVKANSEPSEQCQRAYRQVNGQQSAEGRGYSLATLKLKEYRIQVTKKRSDCGQGNGRRVAGKGSCYQHGQCTFNSISHKCQSGWQLTTHPKYVGGSGIARACGARIGQAHSPTHQDGSGNRSGKIGQHSHNKSGHKKLGREHVFFLTAENQTTLYIRVSSGSNYSGCGRQ